MTVLSCSAADKVVAMTLAMCGLPGAGGFALDGENVRCQMERDPTMMPRNHSHQETWWKLSKLRWKGRDEGEDGKGKRRRNAPDHCYWRS